MDAIHRILRVIVEGTGIQYAGIRIKEDKDYPFYVFRGFSQEFIQQENSLCRRNPDGTLAFDAQGRAELACVCGRVLRGQTNPQHDFFTPGGSFFSPTLQSLAVTVGPETLGSTRGRCIADGFETHALIPLRHDNETIGLLHLSDSRTQFLSGADVAFFERLGTIVGVALAYKQTKQRQILTDDTYRSLFEKLGWGYALHEVLFDQDAVATEILQRPEFQKRMTTTERNYLLGKEFGRVKSVQLRRRRIGNVDDRHVEPLFRAPQRFLDVGLDH